MVQIVLENKDYKQWVKDNAPSEQLSCVNNWLEWEDADVYYDAKSVDDIFSLYAFIQFVVGVEFVLGVYELISEEAEEGEDTTKRQVARFNQEIGYKLI